MAEEEEYITDEIEGKIIDQPVVTDVSTQTDEKHANRRYIVCKIPKKFGKNFFTQNFLAVESKVFINCK